MSLEDLALRFEGFTDEQIEQIKAALPDAVILIQALKAQQARITRVMPVLDMIMQVVNRTSQQYK